MMEFLLVFPFYLLVTTGYLVDTSGYLVITSGYLIATTGYFWLLLVPRLSNNEIAVKCKSLKWFYTIVDIKLGLQYEPENLDVNRVCFAK